MTKKRKSPFYSILSLFGMKQLFSTTYTVSYSQIESKAKVTNYKDVQMQVVEETIKYIKENNL